jgi:predicted dehydrogenase
MGGTTLEPAFVKIKEMLDAKRLGQVICQQALKSYPMFEGRPKEERIDGGLLMQAGIHCVRAMQELSGLTAVEVTATEFNPGTHGDLRLAAAATCTFDNGSVGTLTVNYGNPSGIGFWGNDQLRVWGTDGFVEAVDGLTRLRYSPSEGPFEDLDMPEPGPTYFDRFVSSILDGTAMPYTLERELQSTRVAIAMKQAAETATTVVV